MMALPVIFACPVAMKPPRRMASWIGRWAWPIGMAARAVDAPARPPRPGGAVRRMAW
jgi:hypothetical protein